MHIGGVAVRPRPLIAVAGIAARGGKLQIFARAHGAVTTRGRCGDLILYADIDFVKAVIRTSTVAQSPTESVIAVGQARDLRLRIARVDDVGNVAGSLRPKARAEGRCARGKTDDIGAGAKISIRARKSRLVGQVVDFYKSGVARRRCAAVQFDDSVIISFGNRRYVV